MLCHITTCPTHLNLSARSALDRNNSQKKDLRRHLSLVQPFSQAKEADCAMCIPGSVVVEFEMGYEKMRVSKLCPWGKNLFLFPPEDTLGT